MVSIATTPTVWGEFIARCYSTALLGNGKEAEKEEEEEEE